MPQKIFTQELEGTRRRGIPRKKWKEEVERDLQVLGVRRWRELVADRKKMEGHCSTGQSPQWVVVPMAEEEESTPTSSKWSLSSKFSCHNPYVFLFSTTRATCPTNLILFDMIALLTLGRYKI